MSHFQEIVSNVDFNSIDALIISGGDGTVYMTINQLAINNKLPCAVGILATGSGNDFAGNLKPLHFKSNQVKKRANDLVRVTYFNE